MGSYAFSLLGDFPSTGDRLTARLTFVRICEPDLTTRSLPEAHCVTYSAIATERTVQANKDSLLADVIVFPPRIGGDTMRLVPSVTSLSLLLVTRCAGSVMTL